MRYALAEACDVFRSAEDSFDALLEIGKIHGTEYDARLATKIVKGNVIMFVLRTLFYCFHGYIARTRNNAITNAASAKKSAIDDMMRASLS